ncbi:MAG: NfeD family protein [Pyrinomonadaceae bacterium]
MRAMMMYLFLIVAVMALAFPLIGVVAIARRSRMAKRRRAAMNLKGSVGRVVSKIAPYGAVLVEGELWPAHSFDGVELADGVTIRVVEPRGHALLVSSR